MRFGFHTCVTLLKVRLTCVWGSHLGQANHGVVNNYDILTLPANSFLLIPPGVFFPESGSHWERSSLQPADSRLLWLHILPTGALCHSSTRRNGISTTDNYDVFIPDLRLTTLTDLLTDELNASEPNSQLGASSALLLLLLRVSRRLIHSSSGGEVQAWGLFKIPTSAAAESSTDSTIIEKAAITSKSIVIQRSQLSK